MTDQPTQPRTQNRAAGAGALAGVAVLAIAIATHFVPAQEGTNTVGYADPLAHGLPTACAGLTGPGIRVGQHYTQAQCDALLASRLQVHATGIIACLHPPGPVGPNTVAAMISLSYNIGSRAFCGSSVVRLANAGRYAAACDAFALWNRASGRVVRGLTNRRARERTLCLSGLTS